ncbi:hypothetical protein [Deinococcus multiflagellatus]|uniref:Phage portal protein n=1 Tax=Deinococcus multiflagellatus TaxID=1656887 RepID=A0ABW1ZQ72_9DEIO
MTSGDGALGYGRYGPSRAYTREVSRRLYFENGLFQIATDIAGAFLVGDAISYGTFADDGLRQIVEDFWQANSFEHLLSGRMITEWMLNGEQAVLFPTGESSPATDVPALISLLDVDMGGFELEVDTTRGALPADMARAVVLRQSSGDVRRWEAGEFTWAAHNAMYNDARGWPVVMAAMDFCVAYINMMNMRLNVHQLQQRLLAVYEAFMDPAGVDANGNPDGGRYEWNLKKSGFSRMPENGGVLTVVHQPGYTDTDGTKYEGVRERIDFLRPGQGASEAGSDMKLILRMVALTIGGCPNTTSARAGATRTTASEMGLPSVRLANVRQAAIRNNVTRILRAEAKRRAGPNARFKTVKGSRRKVPVDLIEFPLNFPQIREESYEDIVKRVELALTHAIVDEETAQADLGYDPALIAERRQGQTPKPMPGDPKAPKEKQG